MIPYYNRLVFHVSSEFQFERVLKFANRVHTAADLPPNPQPTPTPAVEPIKVTISNGPAVSSGPGAVRSAGPGAMYSSGPGVSSGPGMVSSGPGVISSGPGAMRSSGPGVISSGPGAMRSSGPGESRAWCLFS